MAEKHGWKTPRRIERKAIKRELSPAFQECDTECSCDDLRDWILLDPTTQETRDYQEPAGKSAAFCDTDPYRSPDLPPGDPSPETLRPPVSILTAAICGLIAAFFYTAANVSLRKSVGLDPTLVSAVKAAPTVLLLGPLLLWLRTTGHRIATSTKIIPQLALAALIAQLIGNVGFQISLGIIGLAATVPITLGVLIIGGAFFGNRILKEPVGPRIIVSMVLLIIAVVVLTMPGSSVVPGNETPLWVGGVAAVISGLAYAFFGVMTRKALTSGLSQPLTMFICGVVGTVTLWPIAFFSVGVSQLATIQLTDWLIMSSAGIFNFSAFVSLTISLKALPVVAVNLLNATQVAMAAVAGVILFSEPVTLHLVTGIGLTIFGLAILAGRKRQPNNA